MPSSRRPRPPLDAAALERLAIAYVGRYATSRAGLARYLGRKLAERGWDGAAPPDLDPLVERLAALGYVDEGELARARARALGRRGLGARRVAAALDALGIAGEERAGALEDAEAGAWESALRFAARRRVGPFAAADPDPAARARAFAAMMRAGHRVDHVKAILACRPGDVPVRDE